MSSCAKRVATSTTTSRVRSRSSVAWSRARSEATGESCVAAHLEGTVRPDNDHMVRTRLLCIENTHNRAAGRIQPYEVVQDVTDWARSHGLATHLDGARLFNAVAATGIAAHEWAAHFDSVSVCFSKGLGAPGRVRLGRQRRIRADRSTASQTLWRCHATSRDHRRRCTARTAAPRRPAGRGPCQGAATGGGRATGRWSVAAARTR